jgi:hypothetical protein
MPRLSAVGISGIHAGEDVNSHTSPSALASHAIAASAASSAIACLFELYPIFFGSKKPASCPSTKRASFQPAPL